MEQDKPENLAILGLGPKLQKSLFSEFFPAFPKECLKLAKTSSHSPLSCYQCGAKTMCCGIPSWWAEGRLTRVKEFQKWRHVSSPINVSTLEKWRLVCVGKLVDCILLAEQRLWLAPSLNSTLLSQSRQSMLDRRCRGGGETMRSDFTCQRWEPMQVVLANQLIAFYWQRRLQWVAASLNSLSDAQSRLVRR